VLFRSYTPEGTSNQETVVYALPGYLHSTKYGKMIDYQFGDFHMQWRELNANEFDGNLLFFVDDYRGDVIEVWEQEGIVSKIDYYPYGGVRERTGNDVEFAPGFAGNIVDLESGLYDFNLRLYSADLGRFITPDPIGMEGVYGRNSYAYALNQPYQFTDPTGATLDFFADPGDDIFTLGGAGFSNRLEMQMGGYAGYRHSGGGGPGIRKIITSDLEQVKQDAIVIIGFAKYTAANSTTGERVHFGLEVGGAFDWLYIGPAADIANGVFYGVEGDMSGVRT